MRIFFLHKYEYLWRISEKLILAFARKFLANYGTGSCRLIYCFTLLKNLFLHNSYMATRTPQNKNHYRHLTKQENPLIADHLQEIFGESFLRGPLLEFTYVSNIIYTTDNDSQPERAHIGHELLVRQTLQLCQELLTVIFNLLYHNKYVMLSVYSHCLTLGLILCRIEQ